MSPLNLITLTTDFGLQDSYVGQVKGAILRFNDQARIIDLTHAISAHDILAAAVSIRSSYHYFPQDTVHMVIVDPGVGSQRKILTLKVDNQYIVAPDNGALTFLLQEKKIQAVHRVENRTLFPNEISATFHGRDIMAPVAAALAGGMDVIDVGPAIQSTSCVLLDIPKTKLEENRIIGRVIHIDRFGNIQTTITSGNICLYQLSSFTGIVLRSHTINAISTTYSDTAEGELVAIIDSSGHLEIALNKGNAAQQINCRIGDPVTVMMQREEE